MRIISARDWSQHMARVRSPLREHRVFIVLTVAALVAAAGVWFGLPHSKQIPNVAVLLVKLVPFVLAVEAIAWMRLGAPAPQIAAVAATPGRLLVYFRNFVP